MESIEKYNCLILIKNNLSYKLCPFLNGNLNIIIKQQFSELLHTVRCNMIHCVVLYCETPNHFKTKNLHQFKQKFPAIPLLVILPERWIKTAHEFGRAGVEKVIHSSDIDQLTEEVSNLIHQSAVKITLKDIGITKLNYSPKLNEALQMLERDYLSLMGVKEIAVVLEINECTLSREFNKYDLPGPKRILMYLKVLHAMRLMQNKGLSKSEIALLSGFSNGRRLEECIQHLYKSKKRIKCQLLVKKQIVINHNFNL